MRIHGIPIGWSPYSSMHALGMKGDGNPVPRATALELVRRAAAWELAGVEIPFREISRAAGDAGVDEVADAARELGLFLNIAANGTTLEALRAPVETAARVGARVVRTVIGGSAMGGDRRPLAGRWRTHVRQAADGLAKVMEVADPLGVRIGIENHQDVNSEELLEIIERVGSPHLGVTFDIGNALATVELPERMLRHIAPHVVNVHIKDYQIALAPSGYRLVRCPIGQGVVDVGHILAALAGAGRDVPAVIELGADQARLVPLYEPDYWDDIPPRPASQLAEVIGFALAHALPPSKEWRTPVERSRPIEEIIAWETAQFEVSLEYLRALAGAASRRRSA